MSFKADHTAIREFGAVIGGLADDADAASNYVQQWLDISEAKGSLYQTTFNSVAEIEGQLAGMYGFLSSLINNSAQEVEKAAQFYQTADVAAAERLDQTY